jgi:hypothetical protein
MRNLPMAIIHVLRQFESDFSERVWDYAKVLAVEAILAPQAACRQLLVVDARHVHIDFDLN